MDKKLLIITWVDKPGVTDNPMYRFIAVMVRPERAADVHKWANIYKLDLKIDEDADDPRDMTKQFLKVIPDRLQPAVWAARCYPIEVRGLMGKEYMYLPVDPSWVNRYWRCKFSKSAFPVQEFMPPLVYPAWMREFVISGTLPEEYDKMFGAEAV